ncbi:MAG: heparinase, partial [Ignavibacteria bacterium]
AKENNAYPGVKMHRTVSLVNDKKLDKPVVVDVYRVESKDDHQYDLPFYFMGHFIDANFDYTPYTSQLQKMGDKNGYQHLWKIAEGKPGGNMHFTWLNGERFYSVISNTDENSEVIFTMIGASDPKFNLRNDQGFIIRRKGSSITFVNILQPHGIFNPTQEFTIDSYPSIEKIDVLRSDDNYTIVNISGKKNIDWTLAICNNNPEKNIKHEVTIENKIYKWTGPVQIIK